MTSPPLGKSPFTADDLAAQRGRLRPTATDVRALGIAEPSALLAMIDVVWSHRERILADPQGNLIYDLYSRIPRRLTSADLEHRSRDTFARFLHTIETYLGDDREFLVQGMEQFGIAKYLTVPQLRERTMDLPQARDYASRTFYHASRRGDAPSSVRIYINLAPHALGEFFCFVVQYIVDERKRFPTVYSAKVSGPRLMRNDSMLIYLSKPDVDGVLKLLRQYQRHNASQFVPGSVRMTLPIEGLVGVSVANEPAPVLPRYQFADTKPRFKQAAVSFGQVRTEILKAALEHTVQKENTKDAFVERALRYMADSGVSKEAPHIQAGMTKLLQSGRSYAF